jgi:hypothetical protein
MSLIDAFYFYKCHCLNGVIFSESDSSAVYRGFYPGPIFSCNSAVDVVYPTIENKNEDSDKETHANENYHSAMDLIALANSSKFYFFLHNLVM